MEYTLMTFFYSVKTFGAPKPEAILELFDGQNSLSKPLSGVSVDTLPDWEALDGALDAIVTRNPDTAKRCGDTVALVMGNSVAISVAHFTPNGAKRIWCRLTARDASLEDPTTLNGGLNPYLDVSTTSALTLAITPKAYRALKTAVVYRDIDAVLDLVTEYATVSNDIAACAFSDYLGSLAEPEVDMSRIVPGEGGAS